MAAPAMAKVSPLQLLPLFLAVQSWALLSTPLVQRPSRTQPRIVCGRPQRPEHGPPGYAKRRTLTGFFVEKEEVISTSRTRLEEQLKRPEFELYDEFEEYDEEPLRNKESLSPRSAVHRANWADPAYRNATLAKRAATLKRNGRTRTEAPAAPPPRALSPAAARKAEAIQLFNINEGAWMQQRLDSGEMQRRLLDDDEAKRELQARRSAVAKERHRVRRAAGASNASAAAAATRKPAGTGTKWRPTAVEAEPRGRAAPHAWFAAAEATALEPSAAKAAVRREAAKAAVAELSAASIRSMKVAELRDALAARKLPTEGLKPALAARLLQHHSSIAKHRTKVAKAKVKAKSKAPEAPARAPARSRRHTQWLSSYLRDN